MEKRLRRAKVWPANRLGTSKSTAIFNPRATTPIHVRYGRRLHHYKRLLPLFLSSTNSAKFGVVSVDL